MRIGRTHPHLHAAGTALEVQLAQSVNSAHGGTPATPHVALLNDTLLAPAGATQLGSTPAVW